MRNLADGSTFAPDGEDCRLMPSTVIRSFRYRPAEEALDITFVSGRSYRYLRVPPALYDEMKASFSKGEFFNRHIRDHFPFERH